MGAFLPSAGGGGAPRRRAGLVGVELVLAPLEGELPWPPDLLVREEDTFLALSAGAAAAPPEERLATLTRAAAEFEPREPGTVVSRGGDPPELAAVVHDLDREPTWCPEWVDAALREVMREADARGSTSPALPVLGAVHGGMGPWRFLLGLTEAVRTVDPWALERLCVRFPADLDPRDARGMERLWREA